MATSDLEKLCSIVSSLGGPTYTRNELEGATQTAPGKALIEWIAAQFPLEDGKDDDEYLQRALLSRIALEDDVCHVSSACSKTYADRKTDLSTYIPPSRQSLRMTLIDNNAYTLEQEVLLLQHRLQQAESVTQQLQKTTHAITAELNSIRGDTVKKQEELESLSLKEDAVIAGTFSKFFRLMKSWQENLHLDVTSDHLAKSLDVRNQITQDVSAQLSAIETWKDVHQLPTSAAHLAIEALRLQRVLGLDQDDNTTGKTTIYYLPRRNQLIQLALENEESHRAPLDIERELKLAWNMDQLAILEARIAVLDEGLSQFHQSVLPPLEGIHTHLAEHQTFFQDSQAILDKFLQEIQEIDFAIHEANRRASTSSQKRCTDKSNHQRRESALKDDLKTAFKNLESLRLSDMPPLVLLDQEDVLSELRALKAKEKVVHDQEEKRCSSLPTALNSLMAMHDAVLNATYAHSELNTSPPFQLSPSVTRLQGDAKAQGDALMAESQRLQKSLRIVDDDRKRRKIKSFVERWNAVS
ncbi:hypothetical protein F5878DRAFT_682094 [Lentinula raphanica]|uniref:Uncharacterized protein n=1 Tax=Lentinula raphanica TaxID=153919 RepID=A0AA38P9F3_9AGAR|nr:hypothetical protein F5878DRAFT_682094 [Lentinula raphanica]